MMKFKLITLLIGIILFKDLEITARPIDYGCAMYGCQCLDARLKMMSLPCPSTNCYSNANCTRLANGECGFEMTRDLKRCLRRPKCEYLGCSVCGVDDGIVPECANSQIWSCYSYGKCLTVLGECKWLKTREMRQCLRNTNPFDKYEP